MKAFQAVADAGSIRSGAVGLGVAVATMRYRIERLEKQCGECLFRRTKAGIELTAAGKKMRRSALAMKEAAYASPEGQQDILVKPGQISIACSEAIGSLWLTPQLNSLKSLLPELTIGLHCDFNLSNDLSESADISIVFTMPSDDDLIISRLGTLHFMCYASNEYIERHGAPRSLEDLRNHNFIEQDAPGMNASMRDFLVGGGGETNFVTLRTNSSPALYFTVANGSGIAAMPTYFSHIAPKLRPIDIGARLRFDMHYCYHRDARNSPSVRTAIDWLKSAFDPVKYPYFGDEFVHPDDIRRPDRDQKVVPLFPGMAEH
ncbi:LysR family transcriptional regulator [Parasphingopyxis marina]|uniref:LysR family transcriptional regulator n=1 Tax=Parasphingopyxis marina TaxID=2761622 RepID=UPI001F2D4773|nr:LysR family transcriptional regulator [Parasphingopyxis marina]